MKSKNTSTKSLKKCDSVEPDTTKTEEKEKNDILALIILGLFCCHQFLSLSGSSDLDRDFWNNNDSSNVQQRWSSYPPKEFLLNMSPYAPYGDPRLTPKWVSATARWSFLRLRSRLILENGFISAGCSWHRKIHTLYYVRHKNDSCGKFDHWLYIYIYIYIYVYIYTLTK